MHPVLASSRADELFRIRDRYGAAVTLKRVNPSVERYDLGPIRFWRDDLAFIVKVVQECGGKLVVQADDWQIDDIDDDLQRLHAEHGVRRLNSFTVTSATIDGPESITLRLDATAAELTVMEPTLQLRGAVESIRSRARERRRLAFPRFLLLPLMMLGAAAAFTFSSAMTSLIFAAFGSSVAGWFAVGRRTARPIMLTFSRSEAPPFLERKRDDIWIALVFGVLGVVAGYALGKWA